MARVHGGRYETETEERGAAILQRAADSVHPSLLAISTQCTHYLHTIYTPASASADEDRSSSLPASQVGITSFATSKLISIKRA